FESACLSAGASPLRARNQVHAPDDHWASAADDPGRLWLPLECSARGHASTAGGIGPHVAALDAAHSTLLASGTRRASCGEWVRLSAPHACRWRLVMNPLVRRRAKNTWIRRFCRLYSIARG